MCGIILTHNVEPKILLTNTEENYMSTINYNKLKMAILASENVEELKKSGMMPPIPTCADEQNFVFISYAHKDYKTVYCDLLEFHKAGLRYWYDQGLPAGEDWQKIVEKQIKSGACAGVIFYMSDNLFVSRSVAKEIEYTTQGGPDGSKGKKYFSINVCGKSPSEIIHFINREWDYTILQISNFFSRLPLIMSSFTDEATYISKGNAEDNSHINDTLNQIRSRFNVIADGVSIQDNAEFTELKKELDFAKNFAIKNGILRNYVGTDTEVIIPDGIAEIGEAAFKDQNEIVRIVIPDSVVKIGEKAFCGCYQLKECKIPDSVKFIGKDAFYHCTSLPIDYGAHGTVYFDNWVIRYDMQNEPISHIIPPGTRGIVADALNHPDCVEIILPEDMKNIPSSIFYKYKYLKSVKLPDKVESIGESAFAGCESLQSISLPDSLTSIESHAFDMCSSIEEITIPNSVTNLGQGVCYLCTSLKRVKMPDNVTCVPFDMFYQCWELENVKLSEKTEVIGGYAFDRCLALSEIKIPAPMSQIGKCAFWGCKSLKTIRYNATKEMWEAIEKMHEWDMEAGKYNVYCSDGPLY